MSRTIVVVNRQARHLARSGPLVDEQRRARATVRSVETTSLADLDRVATEIAEEARSGAVPGPRTVVFAGGDGSYMAGVSALFRAFSGQKLPKVAFAPGGTVGTVARNWGMHGDPVAYSKRLLDAIERGTATSTPRPTLCIRENGSNDDASSLANVRVGFIAGAGLVARFFEVYSARGSRGTVDAARIVARIFAGSFVGSAYARRVLEPSPCTIEVDGRMASFDRVSLLCASVVRDLGLGMKLLYRAGERHDRFHVVATPLHTPLLGPQMPLVLSGRHLLGPRVDHLAKKLRLRFPDGAGAYVLDGDLFRADDIELSAGPVLEILTP